MKVSSIKKGKLLVGKGLSPKTVSKLTESEIDTLYSTLISEVTTQQVTKISVPTTDLQKGVKLQPDPSSKPLEIKNTPKGIEITSEEMELDEDDMEDPMDFEKGERSQDPHQVGVSTDDGYGNYDDGTGEFTEGKKKINPWAICTSQLGKEFGTRERSEWTKKQMAKYESCIQDVKSQNKKSLKENKNSLTLFLENQLIKLVEKHLPPKITKKELMNYLLENSAEPAIKEPIVKPDTPTKPRPSSPGKNPFPKEKSIPKAKLPSPEVAKEKVIDLIINLITKNEK